MVVNIKQKFSICFIIVLFGFIHRIDAENSETNQSQIIDSLSFYAAPDTNRVNFLKNLAWEFSKTDYKLAKYYLHAARALSEKLNFVKGNADIYHKLGKLCDNAGEYDSSIYYYLKSLKIKESINDKLGSIYSCFNLGLVYYKLHDNTHSSFYLQKSIRSASISGNKTMQAEIFSGLGNLYSDNNKLDSARSNYLKALQLFIITVDRENEAKTYSNIGTTYYSEGIYDKALEFYKRDAKIKKNLKNEAGLADTYDNIAIAFETINRDSTQYYFNLAIELSKKTGSLSSLMELYENLTDFYRKQGLFEKAFNSFELYNGVKDSIFNKEKATAIAEMQTKYDTEQKEADKNLAVSKATLRTRQLYYASGGFVLLLFLVGIIFLFYRQRVGTKELLAIKNEQIQNQKIDELLNQQEIKSFQSMIEGQEQERKRIAEDLHDGLGILLSTVKLHFSSIEDKLDTQINTKEQYEKAASLLDQSLREVRRIAHNMSTGILTHTGLVPAMEDLKETIEYSRKIKVNLFMNNMEARLDTLSEISIYRITQELISNILKHAQASEISINLNKDLDTNILSIMIEDDGVGFDISNLDNGKGMGLKNISSRVERLNGKFTIDSNKGKGTTAIIEIQV